MTHRFNPYYRKTTVECKNVSNYDLDAFSVVEIVGATRPEELDIITPGGGRTVFEVTKPTQASPSMTGVTGPAKIPSSRYGPLFVAWECYAQYTGSIAVGDIVGPSAGSTAVSTGNVGYMVAGDINSNEGTCRVIRMGGGSGGGHDIGIWLGSVDYLEAQQIELLQQVGEVNVGQSIAGLSRRDPPEVIVAINISYLTLVAGTPDDGPYMMVEYPNQFDMPRAMPEQIEECLTPNYQPDQDAAT